jgi:hypothetical protein
MRLSDCAAVTSVEVAGAAVAVAAVVAAAGGRCAWRSAWRCMVAIKLQGEGGNARGREGRSGWFRRRGSS